MEARARMRHDVHLVAVASGPGRARNSTGRRQAIPAHVAARQTAQHHRPKPGRQCGSRDGDGQRTSAYTYDSAPHQEGEAATVRAW